jgi:hypothetical protein
MKGFLQHRTRFDNLKYFDFMGPTANFNINGNDNYKTYIGALLSIATIILTLITTYSTIDSTFNKTNPNVFTSSVYESDMLTFNNSNFQFYISLIYLDNQTFKFNPIKREEILFFPIFASVHSNNTGLYYESDYLSFVNCSESFFKDYNSGSISNSEYYSKQQINDLQVNSFCLPEMNYTLINSIKDESLVNIIFLFEAFKSVIEKYPIIFIQINWKTLLLNPNNFTNPYEMVWKNYIIPIKKNYVSYYNLNIESYSVIKDQTAFLFSDEINGNEISGTGVTEFLNLDNPTPMQGLFACLNISKQNLSTQTFIKYSSWNDVLSDFGGSFGILYPVVSLLLRLLVTKYYELDIIDNIYDFYNSEGRGIDPDFKHRIIKANLNNKDNFGHYKTNLNDNIVPANDILALRNNQFLTSFDKEVGVENNTGTSELIKSAICKISSNKTVKIKKRLFSYCIYCKISKSETNDLNTILNRLREKIQHSMEITAYIRNSFLFRNSLEVLLNKHELKIIELNKVNIDGFNYKSKAHNLGVETLLNYLLSLDYEEKKNKKLLKYFIKNYF